MKDKAISLDLLAQCRCRQKRGRHESKEDYASRLTHIGLSKRAITEMASLRAVSGAAAIYLYDNQIVKIEGLFACRFLSQLFLQRNRITKMEGLDALTKLEKLHLGRNRITVVEGIEKCVSLRELHIEDQLLPAGEKLVFDPRCIIGLSGSLEVLNVAGNRIDDLGDLCHLQSIHTLNLSNNFIRSMKELQGLLQANRRLQRLRVVGNPICHINKYRENIITMSISLLELDSKEITKIQRQFLLNWKISKNKRSKGQSPHKSSSAIVKPPVSRFPSKFSSKNPHWLPPLPLKSDPRRHDAQPGDARDGGGYAQAPLSNYEKDYRSLVPGTH